MINDLCRGDIESATDNFNAVFSEKAAAALDQYKAQVGQQFFDKPVQSESVSVNKNIFKVVPNTHKKFTEKKV